MRNRAPACGRAPTRVFAAACAALLLSTACERAPEPVATPAEPTARDGQEQALDAERAPVGQPIEQEAIKTPAEYLAEPRFAAADADRGELLALACIACHTLNRGEPNNLGPNLHGVFGREAASVPDFPYSEALRASSIVWTPQALEAWLANPAGFVPGTTMAFAGYRSADDRRDLIAYLLRATQ